MKQSWYPRADRATAKVVVRSYASSGTNASVSLAGISFTTI